MITLGIVVVVLLALFVVSVVHSPDDNSPGSGCSSRQRDTWRECVLRSNPVAPGQLGGCTTVLGRFTITGACELKVAADDARSRQLTVEALDAMELHLVTNADGRPMTMRVELKHGETKQIFVGKDGQTIRFRCLKGTTCHAGVK
jgi:hypothetical protein